jgi:hypothetical protein
MDIEHKERLREANRRRGLRRCPKDGTWMDEREHPLGVPFVTLQCMGCGTEVAAWRDEKGNLHKPGRR